MSAYPLRAWPVMPKDSRALTRAARARIQATGETSRPTPRPGGRAAG